MPPSDNPKARASRGHGGRRPTAARPQAAVGWGTRIRQILLTGVSYMIPFVAAGGLLIALGFLFAGYDIANTPDGAKPRRIRQLAGAHIATTNSLTNLPGGGFTQYLGAVLFTLGGLAFSFLVPALAGYISFAIADRPGIAPGFTAGAVAVFVGGGFIGGIVGGLIAGFAALWISKVERAAVVARPDAGGDHPAVRLADRRPADVPAAGPPAGRDHLRADATGSTDSPAAR